MGWSDKTGRGGSLVFSEMLEIHAAGMLSGLSTCRGLEALMCWHAT